MTASTVIPFSFLSIIQYKNSKKLIWLPHLCNSTIEKRIRRTWEHVTSPSKRRASHWRLSTSSRRRATATTLGGPSHGAAWTWRPRTQWPPAAPCCQKQHQPRPLLSSSRRATRTRASRGRRLCRRGRRGRPHRTIIGQSTMENEHLDIFLWHIVFRLLFTCRKHSI